MPIWSRICTFVFLLLLLASPLGISIKAYRFEDLKRAPETCSLESNLLLDNSYPTTSLTTSTEENPLEYYEELPSSNQNLKKVTSNDTMLLDEEEKDMNL